MMSLSTVILHRLWSARPARLIFASIGRICFHELSLISVIGRRGYAQQLHALARLQFTACYFAIGDGKALEINSRRPPQLIPLVVAPQPLIALFYISYAMPECLKLCYYAFYSRNNSFHFCKS